MRTQMKAKAKAKAKDLKPKSSSSKSVLGVVVGRGKEASKGQVVSGSQTNTKSSSYPSAAVDSSSHDIVALILRDHKPIKELILILKDSEVSFAKKQPAFTKFQQVLSTHAKAEQESLYVQMKEEDELKVKALEGETEHALADLVMKEINESKSDQDLWMAKVKVLAEMVDHHVKEEEKTVLKDVKNDFSREERIQIGDHYSRLFVQYKKENKAPRRFSVNEDMRAEYV